MSSELADVNIGNISDNLSEVKQKVTLKLEELNDFVSSASRILELKQGTSQPLNQNEEDVHSRTAEEESLIDKLKVLSILPDWLESLNHSIDKFLIIAKSLQPLKPTREIVGETHYVDEETHQQKQQRYKQLLAEKKTQRDLEIEEECRSIVDSFFEMSVEQSESKLVNNGVMSEKVRAECSLLFNKGLPISGLADALEDLLDEDFVHTVSPQKLHTEVQRLYTLNEVRVQEYVKSRNSGHVLGHVVHRLLAFKYPRPPPPPGADMPLLPVMSLILGLQDAEAMGSLYETLANHNIKLILFNDALEACIAAYRQEGPGIPLLESKDPPPIEEDPPTISEMDQILPHAMLGERFQVAPEPTHYEKETQTCPEIIPTLSLAASLGKQALENIRVGKELTDWLMVAILIEYLKQEIKPGVTGWALADFPSTFNQASLFEAAITGQSMPNPDLKEEGENKSKVTIYQSRIVCDPSEPQECMPFKTMFTAVVCVASTEPPQELEMLDYVSLLQEVYLQQQVHYCFHCVKWFPENVAALAELLMSSHQSTRVVSQEQKSEKSEYKYVDFNIPTEFALGLASLWESLETAYLTSLHRAFLTQRTRERSVGKYISTMKSQFENFLVRPDHFETIVKDFQDRHLELPREKLGDPEVKTELQNRVSDLLKLLSEEANARRHEAEAELKRIAGEPWLSRELGEQLNSTSSMVQLELDRYVDTVAILQDYFCSMLERIPPDASKNLRFDVPKAITPSVTDEWASMLVETLISPNEPDYLPEPFMSYLDSMLQGAKVHLEKMNGSIKTSITKLETEFKPKPAASKKKQVVAKTKGKKKGINLTDVPPLEDTEALRLTSLRLQLLQEWQSVCISEIELTLQRLDETCSEAITLAKALVKQVRSNSFVLAHAAYNAQYQSDNHSAETLCEFLGMAVEAEARLESPLIFPRKISYLQFLQKSYYLEDISSMLPVPGLAQRLQGLLDILQRIAPDGIILTQALKYILHQSATSDSCFLPPSWENLDSDIISQLVDKVNNSERIDWRAFLIRVIDPPVATQRQLLVAKTLLMKSDPLNRGLVDKKTFHQTRLWLEAAFGNEIEVEYMKDLWFDIYRNSSRETSNYIDFLIACSHDPNPVLGFAKACAVYSGCLIKTGFEATDNEDREMDGLLSEVNAALPETKYIDMNIVLSVINSNRPFSDSEYSNLEETLKRVFEEVEEQSLTPEERRVRNRRAVATRGIILPPKPPVTTVIANFLLKHPDFEPLVTPAYQTFHFNSLIKQLQEKTSVL